MKSREAQQDIGFNSYRWISLQVSSCMYGFLDSFGMQGTCMWLLGYDLSLAWRISWIDSGFTYPFHFLDNHGVVGFAFVF